MYRTLSDNNSYQAVAGENFIFLQIPQFHSRQQWSQQKNTKKTTTKFREKAENFVFLNFGESFHALQQQPAAKLPRT